jgi:hypothetical protein
MTMDPDGLPCNCGNRGCWETQVSTAAVFRNVRQAMKRQGTRSRGDASPHHEPSRFDSTDLERLTLPLVLAAARAGDRASVKACNSVGRHLGIGVASLVNALNPELVVLGGQLSSAGEFVLPAVEAELQRRALRWNAAATQVVLARHGSDACVMGGVATVTQAVLAEPGLAIAPRVERPGSEKGRGTPCTTDEIDRNGPPGRACRFSPASLSCRYMNRNSPGHPALLPQMTGVKGGKARDS